MNANTDIHRVTAARTADGDASRTGIFSDCGLNVLRVISEEQALAKVLAAVKPLPLNAVSLADARNRYAGTDLFARIAIPAFDNSAMDGYAVIASSAAKGARLKVIGEQPAGVSKNLSLSRGEAIRIFTGAPMPAGADAVVMQEETERQGDFIVVRSNQVSEGEFVRKMAADLARGQQILRRGDRLRPAALGLLASQGLASIQVGARARVAVVTTGDELARPGKELRVGEIFDSNEVMLGSLATGAGANVTTWTHCPDNFKALCTTLQDAAQNDVIIISGGVSVGERDLVGEALRGIGAEIDLWRVSVKPGKPFLFGRRNQCLVFGLPGNPVSAFVTFLVFVRPALLRAMGASNLRLARTKARLTEKIEGDETRPHYLRGNLTDGRFSVTGRQESHALFGLAGANALFRVQPKESLEAGDEVVVLLID